MNRSFGNNFYSSTNSRMSAPSATDWEDLRKQARQLENEIDAKLMSFSKLCSNYVARDQPQHINGNDLTTSPSSSSFETMSLEIEKLVERLSDINKRMADVVVLLGSNSAATHTLQRHHEILQDYRREFERTKANIRNFKKIVKIFYIIIQQILIQQQQIICHHHHQQQQLVLVVVDKIIIYVK